MGNGTEWVLGLEEGCSCFSILTDGSTTSLTERLFFSISGRKAPEGQHQDHTEAPDKRVKAMKATTQLLGPRHSSSPRAKPAVLRRVTPLLSLYPQCEDSEAPTAKPRPRPPPCGCPHGGAAVQAGTQRRRSSHGLMAPVSTGGCDQESADSRGAALRSARMPGSSRPDPSARTKDYASQRPPRPCGGAGHCGNCSPRVGAPSLAERFRRPRALHFPWGSAAGPAAETFASPVSPRWRRGEGGALAPAAPTAAAVAGRGESAVGARDEARPGVLRAGGEREGAGRGSRGSARP